MGQQDPLQVITNRFGNLSINYGGGVVGGTFGVQLQIAHVVLGFEADLGWAGISGTKTFSPTIFGDPLGITVNATTNINWDLTARTRVGYAQDNWLFFATFGMAALGAKTELATVSGLSCGSLGLINGAPSEFPSEPISGSAGHLASALNTGLPPNGSAKLEYAIPPPPRWRPHTSTRCSLA